MKKPKLIKRGEAPPPTKPTPTTINKTVTVVKDWLNTRHQNTKTNAREAFAHLFAQPPCREC
jgi:hypothetical protein